MLYLSSQINSRGIKEVDIVLYFYALFAGLFTAYAVIAPTIKPLMEWHDSKVERLTQSQARAIFIPIFISHAVGLFSLAYLVLR